jgi:ABC-2 type transport system permease protein
MKLAIIRNSMTGGRAALMITGGGLGLLAAATTVWLSLVDPSGRGVVPDLLATAYLVWLLGWVVGPVWGASSVLRVDHFELLPVSRQQLAVGLLGAAFVAVTTAVTALAFLSLVVYGIRQGVLPALVAVPAAALQLVLVVLLSRASYSVFGLIARGRVGSAFTGLLLAAFLVLTQSGWIVVVAIMYSEVLTTGFPSGYSTVVRTIPSGWGVVAVESAHNGQWWNAVGLLAAMVALIGLLLLGWSRTLGSFRHGRATIRGSNHALVVTAPVLAGRTAAVFGKELRTWWRDPARTRMLAIVLGWAMGTALLPLTLGWTAVLPWAGPGIALMAATVACNLYAEDGTALWLTLQTSTEKEDLRGRQWAYLLVFGSLTVAVTVGFTLWSGYTWAWPWLLALVPALLGGGVGLAGYASVVALAPGPDAHKRPNNPLEQAETPWQSQVLFWAGLLPPVPAIVIVFFGTVFDNAALLWAGGPVGLATGVFLAWWLGRVASSRLRAHGPEMLFLLRTGRAAKTVAAATKVDAPKVKLSGRESLVAVLCWILGALCLFPQGVLPVVILLADADLKLWFLALYFPDPLRWPVAILMVLLGSLLLYHAIRLTIKSSRPAPSTRAIGRRSAPTRSLSRSDPLANTDHDADVADARSPASRSSRD